MFRGCSRTPKTPNSPPLIPNHLTKRYQVSGATDDNYYAIYYRPELCGCDEPRLTPSVAVFFRSALGRSFCASADPQSGPTRPGHQLLVPSPVTRRRLLPIVDAKRDLQEARRPWPSPDRSPSTGRIVAGYRETGENDEKSAAGGGGAEDTVRSRGRLQSEPSQPGIGGSLLAAPASDWE